MSVDRDTLGLIGRIWDPVKRPEWVEHDALAEGVEAVERWLARRPPRSVLLVGEDGVGKTTLARALGRRLQRSGRFAGHADVATTMRYCCIADDVYAEGIVSALG